jgi:hypothetical protein
VSQSLAYRCQGTRAGAACSNRAKHRSPAGARCGHCLRADEAKAREVEQRADAATELASALAAAGLAVDSVDVQLRKLRRLLREAARP